MRDPYAELAEVSDAIGAFAEDARRAVYDVIALRRDVRHFRPGADVDDGLLERLLGAAHQAPSVGFSQPWGFVIVRDRERRARIRESFLYCREAEAARFPPERREQYLAHRLEGILEAPVNVCIAVDLRPRGEAILGTTVQPEALRASAACAVQNLWLAARAEGIGVGWVSIVEPAVLRAELALPPGVEPIAYVCVGHPTAFRARPMLEETGWGARRAVDAVIHRDRWRVETPAPTLAPAAAAPAEDSRIPAFSVAARDAARAHQDTLTKPPGSLGRLEELAAWYAGARGEFPVAAPRHPVVCVFAADHGVVVEAVSAYGSQLTAGVVMNIMAGGAAINSIAACHRVGLHLCDVGIAGDLSAAPREPIVPLERRRVRAGTGNLRREAAMTRAEATAALAAGAQALTALAAEGADLVAPAEVGIGNTTAAAALVCAFTGARPEEVVGRGTGIPDGVLARKIEVVTEALRRHEPRRTDPLGVLAALGGLELAAMAGFMLEAARRRIPVVLDGFLSGAAALVAVALDEGVRPYLVAAHESSELGARIVLAQLGLTPFLQLGLRLGEGTGAAIALDLVRTAVTTQLGMATFATAGVVGRAGTPTPPRTT